MSLNVVVGSSVGVCDSDQVGSLVEFKLFGLGDLVVCDFGWRLGGYTDKAK